MKTFSTAAPLSTDEVLERIQQQMKEVMATAQEVANSAVSNENEARIAATGSDAAAAGAGAGSSCAKSQKTAKTKRGWRRSRVISICFEISFYGVSDRRPEQTAQAVEVQSEMPFGLCLLYLQFVIRIRITLLVLGFRPSFGSRGSSRQSSWLFLAHFSRASHCRSTERRSR